MEDIDSTGFVKLRNLASSRLTLFNARRGGETCRLKIKQWTMRHQWLGKVPQEPEHDFLKDLQIMYSSGKGNKLVSTIVPEDTVRAIEILINPGVRLKSWCCCFKPVHFSKHSIIRNAHTWMACNSKYMLSSWD